MLFLDYLYNLPNSTEGLDNIFVEVVTAEPSFIPLLMAFTFFLIFLGGISRQKMRSGTADYPLWAVVASLGTYLVTLVLSLTAGLINIWWLSIVTVVTMFSGIWLFLDRKMSEV